jgi:hypothetical protein
MDGYPLQFRDYGSYGSLTTAPDEGKMNLQSRRSLPLMPSA